MSLDIGLLADVQAHPLLCPVQLDSGSLSRSRRYGRRGGGSRLGWGSCSRRGGCGRLSRSSCGSSWRGRLG